MNVRDVLDAAAFAAWQHGDQMYGRAGYMAHVLEVAEQVAGRGGTEAQVIAALLHDVVEDTDATIEKVRMAFGDCVADIVDAVTKKSDQSDDQYLDGIQGDAVLVKLCDSICNRHHLPGAEIGSERRARLAARYDRNIATLAARLRSEPPMT